MPVWPCGDDQQAIARLSSLLQDGDADDRIAAREGLAGLYEQRGEFDRAAELLIMNARSGAGGALLFFWLERLYRVQGDVRLAARAATEAAKYLPPRTAKARIPSGLPRLRRLLKGDNGRTPTALVRSDVTG